MAEASTVYIAVQLPDGTYRKVSLQVILDLF